MSYDIYLFQPVPGEDPLERVLNLEDDRPEAVDTYGSVVTSILQLNERAKPQPKRPWWKLW